MASQRPPSSVDSSKTYFEQQRALLISEISTDFEQVLANINKLNRSLEAIITVGNEFSSVEALWSQFEGVMGKDNTAEAGGTGEGGNKGADETRGDAGQGENEAEGEEYEEGEEEEEDATVVEGKSRR